MEIDGDILFRMLEDFSKVGRNAGGGITRRGFSPAEREVHQLAATYMKQAGLSVRVDAAGNTIGRRGDGRGPALAIGSHLDTVPNGGSLDGALGVATGIICAHALNSSHEILPWPIEIIAFADEEGAFWAGTLGSRAMMGRLTEKETMPTIDGIPNHLAEAMESVNLNFHSLPLAKRKPSDFLAYLELHIEQGPVLEKLGKTIGIVTGIPYIQRYYVQIHGQADHAGTTPVSMRDDALRKTIFFLEQTYRALGEKEGLLIGNLGDVRVHPGVFNVVPQAVISALELRAVELNGLEEFAGTIKQMLLSIDPSGIMTPVLKKNGAQMDRKIMQAITSSCQGLSYDYYVMPSGAGHDGTSFVPDIPVGMIFVPSARGKSHGPDEWTPKEAILAGGRTLLMTIHELRKILLPN